MVGKWGAIPVIVLSFHYLACYNVPMNDFDPISVFTQAEVEAAIAAIAPADDAKRIADEIFSIPKSERSEYSWTDSGLTLLAMSSPIALRKAQKLVEGSTEQYWEEQSRPYKDFIEAGRISIGMDIDDIVVK